MTSTTPVISMTRLIVLAALLVSSTSSWAIKVSMYQAAIKANNASMKGYITGVGNGFSASTRLSARLVRISEERDR
jgi:hypothetical protein